MFCPIPSVTVLVAIMPWHKAEASPQSLSVAHANLSREQGESESAAGTLVVERKGSEGEILGTAGRFFGCGCEWEISVAVWGDAAPLLQL